MGRVFDNPEVLKETPSDRDFFDYTLEIDRVEKRISSAIQGKESTIIAYLGPFGAGKSSVLRNVHENIGDKARWIEFDTWRYSNRSELWDAFVIKISSELSISKNEWTIADEIDGGKLTEREWVSLSVWVFTLWAGLSLFSLMLWSIFKEDTGFGIAYLKYALPIIFPVLLVYGLGRYFTLDNITDKRPLRRIFQFEQLLHKKLKRMRKPLIVVVEDIDRSGTDNNVFMETLHEFFNKHKTSKPVVIIAPQTNGAFDATIADRTKHIEHSLKVYDQKMYFSAKISRKSIDTFFSTLSFREEYVVYRPIMNVIAWELAYYYQDDQLTVRMLKHALREVDWFIEAYPDYNPAVAFVFAMARMITPKEYNDLAVRHLGNSVRLKRHDLGNGVQKYVIDSRNVFGVCLAMAVGAGTMGKQVGLLTMNEEFNQDTSLRSINIFLDAFEDFLEIRSINPEILDTRISKEYNKLLRI